MLVENSSGKWIFQFKIYIHILVFQMVSQTPLGIKADKVSFQKINDIQD
jgi:hypothetical protein